MIEKTKSLIIIPLLIISFKQNKLTEIMVGWFNKTYTLTWNKKK
jgi:hypothetical protein